MPALEIALVSFGTSLVKNLIGMWLSNKPVANAAGASIADVLSAKITDHLSARDVARRFEGIGDRIAANLKPVFEDANLSEGSVEAVIHQLSDTVTSAELSIKLLSMLNNDSANLYEYMQERYPLPKAIFSEAEESLYKRALREAATYLVDLAQILPEFVPTNITEVLRHVDLMQDLMEKIMQDVESIRMVSDQANRDTRYAAFEKEYRTRLADYLSRMELIGANLTKVKKYDLSVAYVNLNLNDTDDDDYDDYDDSLATKRVSVELALSMADHSLIIGEAGSGKTTLLKWLAIRAARNDFDEAMNAWSGILPFFIELRRFKNGLPAPEEFLDRSLTNLKGIMPGGWVHNVLESQRALLLVDGFDEVAEERRSEVVDWLERLLLEYPGNRVVVTSRPAAADRLHFYDDEVLLRNWELMPMGTEEVEQFVRYWHAAAIGNFSTAAPNNAAYEQRVLSSLRENMPIARLATNPLLCAMICALHYEREMHLPRQRNELYEACVQMLLDRRDTEREVLYGTGIGLTYPQKRLLVEDLAYWMMRNNYASTEVGLARERMASRLGNMALEMDGNESDRVLTFLIERSGLLRLMSGTDVDFVHRTFQEYLAASSVDREADWGSLLDRADDDQWRETIKLAMGFANLKQADSFISQLLERGGKSSTQQTYFDLLAIGCTETIKELSSDIREKVKRRIGDLVPPKSSQSVNALAAAGDLAIPFLQHNPKLSEAESVACVDVLVRNGSTEALKTLGTYIHGGNGVEDAVIEGVRYFRASEVSASGLATALIEMLRNDVHSSSLTVPGSLALALMREPPEAWNDKAFTGLQKMVIPECVSGSLPLHLMFPSIEAVHLDLASVTTVEMLNALPYLTEVVLWIRKNPWPTFYELDFAGKVSSLRLISDSEFDPRPLEELARKADVKHLSLFASEGGFLPTLDDIYLFRHLETLELGVRTGTFPDLGPLRRCSNLKQLRLSSEESADHTFDKTFGLDELEHVERVEVNSGYLEDEYSDGLQRLKDSLPSCEFVVGSEWRYDAMLQQNGFNPPSR